MPLEPSKLRATALKALAALGRVPNVSYYEYGADYIRETCEGLGLEVQVDRWGNVLATRAGSEPGAPGLAFVAHMDHPGYEAVEQSDGGVVALVHGGLPAQATVPGVSVLAVQDDGRKVPGETIGDVTGEGPRRVNMRFAEKIELPCPVILDLPDFDLSDERITMRAADDLAGCAAIIGALSSAVSQNTPGAVYGVFTRAEEVGLIGARLAAEDGMFPRNTVVVSVETSLALPGAEMGNGPVIRTGDRRTTFDMSAENYLGVARAELEKTMDGFQCQRQLMGAGGCEASAFSAFGYSVTGLAFPLGNWHNNAPDGTVRAEQISTSDFANGVLLLAQAASLAGTSPVPASAAGLRRHPEAESARLLGGPSMHSP